MSTNKRLTLIVLLTLINLIFYSSKNLGLINELDWVLCMTGLFEVSSLAGLYLAISGLIQSMDQPGQEEK
jgi:hypothetical protein